MKSICTRGRIAVLIIALVLVIDQIIKIWVKTTMHLHERIRITDWFYILFTENRGMAFGMEFVGKIFLTSFRILAVAFITYYLVKLIRSRASWGYIICIAFVLAGAAGNIFDSLFYGLIFSESTPFDVAQFVPFGEGYDQVMHGKVVDMFYFPLFGFDWPQWMPMVGGEHFVFFSPIFNFADAAITCGILTILLFYRKHIANF